MSEKWEYEGTEPNGKWKLTINPGQGAPVQVYVGKTKDDVTQALIAAQGSATRHIDTLQRRLPKAAAPAQASAEGQPPAAPPKRRQPQPLTETERFQVASDMTSPANVDKAVQRVLESVTGIPVEALRENNTEAETERKVQAATAAANEFATGEPDWYPSEFNRTTLIRYMITLQMDNTDTQNYHKAFRTLSEAGLLQMAPDSEPVETDDEPPPQRRERISPMPNGANGKPRSTSTGVRSTDISGQPPRPVTPRSKYTPQMIARMGKDEFRRLMESGDQDFLRAAEQYRPNVENSGARSK